MDWQNLIPAPDTIPAPWGVFEFLDILTFILHILIINIVVGGTLLILTTRLFGKDQPIGETIHGALTGKIPTLFALGVTIGVAPLLFVQVLYGQMIYSSSVLMAVFWIMIIPIIIIGYYGAYVHRIKFESSPGLSKFALLITALSVLYIAFMFVNNMTLMLQPSEWFGYFADRGGTILNLGDPTLFPRYFHFIAASVAVAGLFGATVWKFRANRPDSGEKVKKGLRIFSFATMVQIAIGVWLLLSLPKEYMMLFMGKNMLYTIILTLGIILGVIMISTSIRGKYWLTVSLLLTVVVTMALSRAFLRAAYLGEFFSVDSLELAPQYDVLAVFLAIFIIGLIIIWYMLRLAVSAYGRKLKEQEVAR